MHRPVNTNRTPNQPQPIEPQAPTRTTTHGTNQGPRRSPRFSLSQSLNPPRTSLLYVDDTDLNDQTTTGGTSQGIRRSPRLWPTPPAPIINPTTNPARPIVPQAPSRTKGSYNSNQGIGRSPPIWLTQLLLDEETDRLARPLHDDKTDPTLLQRTDPRTL